MNILHALFVVFGIGGMIASTASADPDALENGFLRPPAEARPWVYWFWLNGNITPEGITADLEAMKRVGIGGVLIMEVDQGAPVGPVDFMGLKWRELFQHVHSEAIRLGLEVNMNNDAGWNGSGGPWIKPEHAMQEVVWTETEITGPQKYEGILPQPAAVAGFYRDISVLAFPAVGGFRIPAIESKAAFQKRGAHKPSQGELTPQMIIPRDNVLNLSASMDTSGRLMWEVPSGEWTVIRFGHTCTGVENAPAPKTGRGLECDKLSREGIEANFTAMMAKLAKDTRLGSKPGTAGLVAAHIDSWENGSQNWTATMRDEFRRRRGYDLMSYMPALTGRVIDTLDRSERFLWDLRQTISELVIEHYAGRMRELAHQHGMRFTVEAYGSPCDAIPYGGQSDEPMGEFWTPNGAIETCRGMASAAHVYGKRIVGAEAFTSADRERWLEHPAILKSHGDRAFCEGINRFVFHRYALQPWKDDRRPGMTMGPWGQHYERTQTWWEWTPAWHDYLARCQFLLRQGLFVADICRLQVEAPPQGFGYFERNGYDWDECGADVVLTRMSVRDGRIVLPDGMSYRLLVLPPSNTMTPRLLRRIMELVEAGATIVGPRPTKSPSLSDYPNCDGEVERLGAELWGDCDGIRVKEHRFGRGRVVWGIEPEKTLQQTGIPQDFSSDRPLRYIHRATNTFDLYFVANPHPFGFTTTCSFRITQRIPELWRPDSGRIKTAAVWEEKDGVTRVSIPFDPSGSVFVVFRKTADKSDTVVLVKHDGKEILSAAPEPPMKVVIRKALYGILDDPSRTRDVTAKVQRKVDAGEFSFPALRMAEGDDPAQGRIKTLVVNYAIDGKDYTVKAPDPDSIRISRDAVQVTVEKARYGVLNDPGRTRDVREKLQRFVDSGETGFKVAWMAQGDDPAFLIVKTLEVDYLLNGERHRLIGRDPDTLSFVPTSAPSRASVEIRRNENGNVILETRKPGEYEIVASSGQSRRATVEESGHPTFEIAGPWLVRFEPGRGAPEERIFDHLMSWSEHNENAVKYFSGEATYTKTFSVPSEMRKKNRRLTLDLGAVSIMAEITLNGRKFDTLWKPPFEVDITDYVKSDDNQLIVRVVNLWPNRMIGDEQLPEDSERNPDGTLKKWPQWLLDGEPSPTGRITFSSWRLWKKDEPLIESGLIGPVTLYTTQSLTLKGF